MSTGTQRETMTPEALLRHVAEHGATGGRQPLVIACAALHIREGLDNLARAINEARDADL